MGGKKEHVKYKKNIEKAQQTVKLKNLEIYTWKNKKKYIFWQRNYIKYKEQELWHRNSKANETEDKRKSLGCQALNILFQTAKI